MCSTLVNVTKCIVYIFVELLGVVWTKPRVSLVTNSKFDRFKSVPQMELFCHELVEPDSSFRPVRAFRDAVLTRDSRVCQNLLSSERPSIKPRHRTDRRAALRAPDLNGMDAAGEERLNESYQPDSVIRIVFWFSDSILMILCCLMNHINPTQWFESCSDSVIRFSWSYAVLWIISTRLSDSNHVLIQWFDSHDLMLCYESCSD